MDANPADLLNLKDQNLKTKERERHASETTSGNSEGSLKENRSENINKHVNGDSKTQFSPQNQSSIVEKLFSHGHCSWPGCESALPDSAAFFRHLSANHILDDKSTVNMNFCAKIHFFAHFEKHLLTFQKYLNFGAKNIFLPY